VSERLQQTLQSARGAMDALAQVDILDFDDSAASSAHGVDGVYAEPAIANEPRHDCLSHTEATFLSCDAHWGASGAGISYLQYWRNLRMWPSSDHLPKLFAVRLERHRPAFMAPRPRPVGLRLSTLLGAAVTTEGSF
jgi:hypothetical protein